MSKVFECMNAANLPITKIDEDATLTMYIDDVGSIETVIQIKVGNETVRIHPATISASLERCIASDLWKAYYLPMYYQAKWLCSAIGRISRAMSTGGAQVDHPVTITYHAKTDTFNVDYRGNEYILSCGDNRILLECEHPIPILESPVFKVDSESTGMIKYAIEEKTIIAINELLLCRPMCDPLLFIIGYSKERVEFLKKYDANA